MDRCPLNHGSSGGPWLVDYDDSGLGYINGVMSYGFLGSVGSSYFDSTVHRMYARAAG